MSQILIPSVLKLHTGVVMLVSPSISSGGTGFHIKAPSGKWYILTNKHVCDLAGPLDNTLTNQSQELMGVTEGITVRHRRVIKRSLTVDLCLIEPIYKFGITRFAEPSKFIPAITIGFGGLNVASWFIGRFEDPHLSFVCTKPTMFGCREVERYFTNSFNLPIIGGHSGSPVINTWGALIGVIFAGNGKTSKAVPIKYVKEFLKDM